MFFILIILDDLSSNIVCNGSTLSILTEKNAHKSNKSLGYYENYLCSLKKTLKIIDYLNENDPKPEQSLTKYARSFFTTENPRSRV